MASEQPKQNSGVTVFVMQKMDCPTEERLIRNKLEPMPGIEELRFDLMQRELTVRHSFSDAQPIETALTQLGMEPKRKVTGVEDSAEQPETISRLSQFLVAISGIAAFVAEIVSWTVSEHSLFVIGLSVVAILTGGVQTARKGLIAIRTLTLNINFLMAVAIAGALVIGEWPEAAMVTFLFALAELIEAYSLDRARHAIRGLMEMTPETALVRQDDSNFTEMPAANVVVGAVVRVKPGARIPLDGTVVGGNSTVNQAPITGESMPVEKKSGDSVFAGTINERGVLEMRVTANKGDTTLARIIRSVQAAQAERAPTQRFVDKFARYYTPAVVLLAALIAVVPPLAFGAQFMPWFYKALVTLVIACPCALVISTPVTVVSGLAAAARRGILIKGGVYLEEGRKLKALALDKTGTLTRGKPEVTDIEPLNELAPEHYLILAAALDGNSDHPVASAVVRHSQGVSGGRSLPAVTEFESITGRGVKGRIDGVLHYIGNHRLVEELGICGPQLEAALDKLERQGKTVIVLMDERQPLCIFAVADTVRDTSIQAVKELQALGVHCVMLTGDNATTAKAIGAQVGIDDVRGNLLPEDKVAAITDLRQRYGVVGMVGDGVNDAPALANSSIGFAMGAAGTDTALETADVALMQDDLRRISVFIALSNKTGNVLKQNITLAIGIKVVFLALNVAGLATLWMAVFADMGASLIVVFNGLRILKFKK